MIHKFDKPYEFLSNFYPSRVYYKGVSFPSVEHAYQASKTYDEKIIKQIASLRPDQAGKAKRIGKKCKLRSDWEDIKIEVMEKLLRQKFDQKTLKEKLLKTGDQIMIEGNYWHDNFWGHCYCVKCSLSGGGFGKNILGQLLMRLREEYNESINNR